MKLNNVFVTSIKTKNTACKPANGTVSFSNLGFKNKNNTNENNNELEKRTKKATVGKLTPSSIKNKISPRPITSINFLLIFILTYTNKTSITSIIKLMLSNIYTKNTSKNCFE
jgi:hypothetical protein